MQHPDEGMIHTWLDGELSPEETAALEAHAETCEQCKAAIAEARGFIAASSRIVSSLDAVPAGVIPVAKKPAKRTWYASSQFRAAAAVIVVAGASLLVMRTGSQKATMAVSTRADVTEASTAQRVMSASGPSSASSSAPVQPPVVTDQAAAKEAVKPARPQGAREMATLRAPAIAGSVAQKVVADEADFSGKGVKGGSASGLTQPDLKVLRVDSSAIVKNTVYQLPSGRQVVLTEQPAEFALSKVMVTGTSSESRKTAAQSVPAAANAPVAPVPAAPDPVVKSQIAVHTISWLDPSTRHRYSLSGPVSLEELEAIKAQLLKAKP